MISLAQAVAVFQAVNSGKYWEEHGITDRECADGLVAMFRDQKVAYEDDCVWDRDELVTAEELQRREEARVRWAAEHPAGEEVVLPSVFQAITQSGFLERTFLNQLVRKVP